MSKKIKVGKVVRLKSGGPAMTVSRVADDTKVYCVWFSGLNKVEDVFKPKTLTVCK